MNELTSAQNPKYKRWLSLLESKGIRKESLALVSGEKLVREFLDERPSEVEDILLPPKADEEFSSPFRQTRLSSPLFRAIDVLGTHSPILVVRIPSIPQWKEEDPRGLEIVVALGDPANLGALLRSAEAFGVTRVVLTQECANPFLPRALKSAANSTFRLSLARAPSVKSLRLTQAVGLDMEGEDINSFHWPKNCYLVLGEEGLGLPELPLRRVCIPMHGPLESLNATVAASIALFCHRTHAR